jgi:hypothetical protein
MDEESLKQRFAILREFQSRGNPFDCPLGATGSVPGGSSCVLLGVASFICVCVIAGSETGASRDVVIC